MAKYKDKWKTTFPASIGNQTRPEDGVDNTQEYNTDGLPQYMANDPVRYDLQNAVNSQLVSNDERLNEKIKRTSDDLAAHNKDPKAHATGISGNAATASKLATPRTLSLTGKAAGSTTFDGSANASINVTSINADTATKATQDGAGNVITNTYLKKAGDTATGDLTAPNFVGHLKGNADSATNADKLDGCHENSFLRYRGQASADGEDTLWSQIGIKEYDDKLPKGIGGTYSYGAVVSLPAHAARLDIWYNHHCSANKDGLWYRSGFDADQQPWAQLLDSNNYTDYAPTKAEFNAVSKQAQTQVDWNSTDSSSIDFIKNVPNSIKSINNSGHFRTKSFTKNDNHGWPTYKIVEELTKYHPTERPTNWGVHGFSAIELCDIRGGNGYHQEPAFMYASLGFEYDMLQSTSSEDFPVVLHNTESDKYYLAIRTNGSSKIVNLIGVFVNADVQLGEEVLAQDGNGTLPSGWELTYKPKDMLHMNSLQAGRANDALKLTYKRLIKLTGDMAGDIYFDGSKDITVNTTVNKSKHAADVTDATVSPEKSNAAGLTVPASGAIDNIKSITGSSDLTNMAQFRSFIGSVFDGETWYNMLSLRHRNGLEDGAEYGLLMYSKLEYVEDAIHYKKQNYKGWTKEHTLLDSSNYNNYAPTKTGEGASGTWNISITGNAASATNADTVDGYHASDLLRTLGGNRTPVITDIFDRAGTIDMSTMSATDKATHKANINKAPNMIQNLWSDTCGIYAYGGDTDINGYYRGTLKLTQSWKNFDKLMIVYSDDDGNWEKVRMFDVYEFNYCMKNLHSINLFSDYGVYWYVYGLTKHGTDASFIPSTETVLSCRKQNASLIGIYGIKF